MPSAAPTLPSLVGLFVVGAFVAFSAASTGGGDGPKSQSACGKLEGGLAPGEPCEDRDQCEQICCLCEGSDLIFVARGCNLDQGVCLGGDDLCVAALAEDPSLCEGGDAEP